MGQETSRHLPYEYAGGSRGCPLHSRLIVTSSQGGDPCPQWHLAAVTEKPAWSRGALGVQATLGDPASQALWAASSSGSALGQRPLAPPVSVCDLGARPGVCLCVAEAWGRSWGEVAGLGLPPWGAARLPTARPGPWLGAQLPRLHLSPVTRALSEQHLSQESWVSDESACSRVSRPRALRR